MQVTSPKITFLNSKKIFESSNNLSDLLHQIKEISLIKSQTQIASISWQIKPGNPFSIIKLLLESEQKYFYFERADRNEAIAGVDTAVKFTTEGTDRFSKIKQFISSSLSNTISVGDLELPLTGPHFFCNFTFFDSHVESGFPFSTATVFLPAWQIACSKGKFVAVANITVNSETEISFLTQKIWNIYHKLHFCNYASSSIDFKNQVGNSKLNVIDAEDFEVAVKSALQSIQTDELKKVVLAHAVDITSPRPFNPLYSVNKLRIKYPNCYVFCTNNGKGQSFIGASPEHLISVRGNELTTEALAGSAPRGQTASEDVHLGNLLLSSKKDIREHRIVIESIAARLSQLGIEPEIPSHPCLLKLPNIQHLHTPIKAKMPENLHLLDVLAELHPTPAVGGEPRDVACQKIRHYENFERGLYAAPIGWVDYKGNGEFAVAIRSALLNRYHARLFAGAGIVADSDPSKESEEIKLKLQVLMEALF